MRACVVGGPAVLRPDQPPPALEHQPRQQPVLPVGSRPEFCQSAAPPPLPISGRSTLYGEGGASRMAELSPADGRLSCLLIVAPGPGVSPRGSAPPARAAGRCPVALAARTAAQPRQADRQNSCQHPGGVPVVNSNALQPPGGSSRVE